MRARPLFMFMALLLTLPVSPMVMADADADDADSLDFGSFHRTDDERRKLWQEKSEKNQDEINPAQRDVKIQVRESLAAGPATSALNQLYGKMQQTCPQGWNKKREWAEPSDGEMFLFIEFQCR